MAVATPNNPDLHEWPEWALALSTPGRGSVGVLKSNSGPVAVVGSTFGGNDVDTRKMCISHVLVTPTPDLQGDVVVPSGGMLDAHRKTPTVLFDHGVNYQLPIAKACDRHGMYTVRKSKNVVTASTYFTNKDKASDQLFTLAAEGMINGWSAGFFPIQNAVTCIRKPVAKSDRGAYRFDKWWLKEYSLTPDPVNRECLTIKVEKSMSSLHPQLLLAFEPHLLKTNSSTITVPDHPLVKKSMNEDTPEPVNDGSDESADTQTPNSPGVQAAYTIAQGLTDLCEAAEQQIAQSDNPKFKKLIRNLCASLEKSAASAQSLAAKMESELGEDDEPVDYEADESGDAPDADDDGQVMTKSGWKPPRFALVTKSNKVEGKVLTPETEAKIASLITEVKHLRKIVGS